MVEGHWSSDITLNIKHNNIRGLFLNYARGWKGDNYDFLADLTRLELLQIAALSLPELNIIEVLSELKYLSISPQPKRAIEFTRLKNLRSCAIRWWPGASSLFGLSELEYLFLDTFKTHDFSPLAYLNSLKRLSIGNSNIDTLEPVSKLISLEKLELLNCRSIERIDSIEALQRLKWLRIDGSKSLSMIGPISKLKKLQILDLSNCSAIPSLAPLADLKELRALAFDGSTIISDGDLAVLEGLPNLSMLAFSPRIHYSHKLDKIWNWRDFSNPNKLLSKK
jgi:Leucine-rich repeat (LRR) protein